MAVSPGFQTQLSKTFNKRVEEGQPTLEGFFNPDGRLGFRLVNTDGSVVPQPSVTTPGVTKPSAKSTFGDIASPTVSGSLAESVESAGLIVPGGFATSQAEGGPSGTGPEAQAPAPPNTGNLTAFQGFMNALAFTNPVTAAIGFARAALNKKDLTTSGLAKDITRLTDTAVSPTRGPDIRGGVTTVSPTRGPNIRGNTRSTRSLNSMSNSGSTQQQGPGETRARGGISDAGSEQGGRSAVGGEGSAGGPEGPGAGGGRGGGPGGRF